MSGIALLDTSVAVFFGSSGVIPFGNSTASDTLSPFTVLADCTGVVNLALSSGGHTTQAWPV